MITDEVFFMNEKIGTLLTDGPRRDRFLLDKAIEKYKNVLFDPRWKEDMGWTYILLWENMIQDTMRQDPNAKYIARFTNEFVLGKVQE